MPLINFRLFDPPIVPYILDNIKLFSPESLSRIGEKWTYQKASSMIDGTLIKSATQVAIENAGVVTGR